MGKNSELEYFITGQGRELINSNQYKNPYYDELREHVKRLKENPEKKGWDPCQLDLGGLTNAQSQLLYLFEKDEFLSNAKIARILRRQPSATHRDLTSLVNENHIEKNQDGEYGITSAGLELTQRNVSRNTRCELTRDFVLKLKARPERRGLYAMIVAVLAGLGLIKSNPAHAITSPVSISSMSSTPIASSINATTVTTASVLSSKTALASIIAVMLVTSGVYIAEPELFGINQDITTSDVSYSNISSDKISQVGANSVSDFVSTSSSISSSTSQILSQNPSENTQNISQSQDAKAESTSAESTDISKNTFQGSSSISTSSQTSPISSSTIEKFTFSQPPTSVISFIDDSFLVINDDLNAVIQITDISDNSGKILIDDSFLDPTLSTSFFDGVFANFILQAAYATENTLWIPIHILVDSQLDILVTDIQNNQIHKFDTTGEYIKSIQLNPFSEHDEIVMDTLEFIYVTDKDNDRIYKYNINAASVDNLVWATNMKLDYDDRLFIDFQDILHITNTNNEIQQMNSDSRQLDKLVLSLEEDDYVAAVSGDHYYTIGKNIKRLSVTDSSVFGIFEYSLDNFKAGVATIDSEGNLMIFNLNTGLFEKFSFDEMARYSESFEDVMCDTDSMINKPLFIPTNTLESTSVVELLSNANSLAESEQFEESLFLYYIALQIEPDNIHAWNGIGYSQTFLCENNAPIDAYQKVLEIDPDNTNALNGLGFFYTNQAIIQSQGFAFSDMIEFTANLATSYYKQVPNYETNANSLNGIGTVYTLLEEYDLAIEYFGKSLEINSERIVTINGMANAQLKSGNLVLAESYYDDALNIDRNNFDALSGLLSIYLQQDNQDKINEIIDRLEQFKEQVIQSLIEQGEWFAERGSDDNAKQFFEKALQLDPENEIVLKLLSAVT